MTPQRTGWRVRALILLHGRQKGLYQIGFSPDGRVLRTAGKRGPLLWHWNLADERWQRQFIPLRPWIKRVTWSPDGKYIAAGSGGEGYPIGLWEMPGGKERHPLIGHKDTAVLLRFSPDGKRLASFSNDDEEDSKADRVLHVWDVTMSREIRQIKDCSALNFSPDGRLLVGPGPRHSTRIWEIASGLPAQDFLVTDRERIGIRLFAPDGRTIATSTSGATILLWDVTGLRAAGDGKAPPPGDRELALLLKHLAADDAALAQQAVWKLVAAPAQALPYLEAHLRPLAPLDKKKIEQLFKDLDDDAFAVRRRAARDLAALDDRIVPVLRKAREETSSAEVRHAVQRLLAKHGGKPRPPLSVEELRGIRALQVLEQIGSPIARRLVRKVAEGDPYYWLTREAKATLERLCPTASP